MGRGRRGRLAIFLAGLERVSRSAKIEIPLGCGSIPRRLARPRCPFEDNRRAPQLRQIGIALAAIASAAASRACALVYAPASGGCSLAARLRKRAHAAVLNKRIIY
jgi:hypothetical protein